MIPNDNKIKEIIEQGKSIRYELFEKFFALFKKVILARFCPSSTL